MVKAGGRNNEGRTMVTRTRGTRAKAVGRGKRSPAKGRKPAAVAKRTRPAGANREHVRRIHAADPALSQVQIAQELGITRQRVKQIAIELGLVIKPSGTVNDADPPRSVTKEQVRDWRLARQLTQSAMATMLGVSTDTLARWERGQVPMPAMLAVALEGLTCAEG